MYQVYSGLPIWKKLGYVKLGVLLVRRDSQKDNINTVPGTVPGAVVSTPYSE